MDQEGVGEDPVAIDLNVDAALLLQQLVGIDSYPSVLALRPNIYRLDDRDRVHAVVGEQLTDAGVIVDGRVHPVVEHWLQCLYRPDVELACRILDYGRPGERPTMLRMSLIRTGETHVLAVRLDDHIVIQSVFQVEERIDILTAAVNSALGPADALRFEPVAAPAEQFAEVSAEPAELRRTLVELGAQPHTAGVLSRVADDIVRRAEITVVEHHDGAPSEAEVAVTVLDTGSGRIIITPSIAVDGRVWATYAPGDEAALNIGVAALVELLPGRSWYETSRVA